MKIIRQFTHISGFLYDQPMAEIPALTHCGEALCARGHGVKIHSHIGFEFHYLSRGGPFGWETSREKFEQKAGEIIVTYPGEPHLSGMRTWPESHFLWIGLKLADMGTDGRRLAKLLAKSRCRLLSGCHETEPVLRGLIAQVISRRPHRGTTARSYLQTFIALLEQRVLSAKSDSITNIPLLPYSHSTMKAVSYLEKNPERRIPLSELAEAAACRSVTNFCTRFRREVGVSPAAYHRRLRLQGANETLRQPGFTVTTVALQFGFNSSQHFSTCFRREFGVSPRRAVR
jgi:AraC-like DNA-binding protein